MTVQNSRIQCSTKRLDVNFIWTAGPYKLQYMRVLKPWLDFRKIHISKYFSLEKDSPSFLYDKIRREFTFSAIYFQAASQPIPPLSGADSERQNVRQYRQNAEDVPQAL